MDLASAYEAMGDYPGWQIIDPSPDDVIAATARFHCIEVGQMMSEGRRQHQVHARMMAMWLMRERLRMSFPAIGAIFHKDHSTVIHGYQLIEARICAQPGFAATVRRLQAELV